MAGIKVNDKITITQETSWEDLGKWLVGADEKLIGRCIRIYGAYQAKKTRYNAIEILQNNFFTLDYTAEGYDAYEESVDQIQNLN